MEYSFLFPLMQKLRKSIKKCKTYSRKATGLFFSRTRCIQGDQPGSSPGCRGRLTVNSSHGELVTCDEFTFHQKVNSSHGDLVALKTRWPSHTELVTVVTRTITTSTAPIYSPTTPSATCVCSLAVRPRETDDLQAYCMSVKHSGVCSVSLVTKQSR